MAPKTRFLRIFECKVLSLNFVRNDNNTDLGFEPYSERYAYNLPPNRLKMIEKEVQRRARVLLG